ncbi:MAG: response regulator [Nanoarchaeota archaeon]|nr:response regulator [Nanoarchaeota archaeon]
MLIPPTPLEIVLVDDEKDILGLLQERLEEQGYKVIPFLSARSSLEYITQNQSIALLLTDYNMGIHELNGAELIAAVKVIDPFLPAFCLTGYDELTIGKQIIQSGGCDVILKKTDYEELSTKISKLLSPRYDVVANEKRRIVLKAGGSVQDRDFEDPSSQGLINLISVSEELQSEGYQIIINTGLGPLGDVTKARLQKHSRQHPAIRQNFPIRAEQLLTQNLGFIQDLFEQSQNTYIFDPSSLKNLEGLEKAMDEHKIILAAVAPRHLTLGDLDLVEDEYKSPVRLLAESDYQALRLAEYFGERKLILVKNTPGIFKYDPLRGESKGPDAWRKAQKKNQRLEEVTPAWFLDGRISRIGTDNRDNHLLETAALRAMRDGMEVLTVCPEYSRFRKSNIFPQLFPTSLDDKQHLKYHLLTAAGIQKPFIESPDTISRIKSES